MVADFSDKSIVINRVPIVEGAYTAAALLQAGAELSVIQTQLSEIELINKEFYYNSFYKWAIDYLNYQILSK